MTDVLGLPEGQPAFAGGDDNALGMVGGVQGDTRKSGVTRNHPVQPHKNTEISEPSRRIEQAWHSAGILACLLWAQACAAGGIPLADNLQADFALAAQSRRAMVLFFTQPHCHWCEGVRKANLEPMANEPAYRTQVLVREVDIRSGKPLRGPGGESLSHEAYARATGVKVTPTVIVINPKDPARRETIVGARIPDFYQAYLDNAVAAAMPKP